MTKSSGNFERFLVIGVALAIVVISVLLNLTVRVYRIPQGAMAPAMPPGCRVLAVNAEEAGRGDVVAFYYPVDRQYVYLFRVVAIGGDEVRIVDKQLYVNGKPAAEPYKVHGDAQLFPDQPALPEPYRSRDQFGPFRVPPGHYFVMGDNRDYSSDSRYWGTVPRENLIGRVKLVFTWRGGFRRV